MLCMYISQCARRDGIEHGSIINIFSSFRIACLRFDGNSHFISRSTFPAELQTEIAQTEFHLLVIFRMVPGDFLSSSDLNWKWRSQSRKFRKLIPVVTRPHAGLRLIRIPFATFPLFFSLSLLAINNGSAGSHDFAPIGIKRCRMLAQNGIRTCA